MSVLDTVLQRQEPHGFEEVDTNIDFSALLAAQKVVLYSISSVGMGPRVTDCRDPGVRIYGCFATPEEALAVGEEIRAHSPECSMLVGHVGGWLLAASSAQSMQEHEERVQARIEAHRAREENIVEEHETRVQQARDAPAGEVPPVQEQMSVDTPAATGSDDKAPRLVSRVPADIRTPQQTVAVCAFVRDLAADADPTAVVEFAFCVYGVFRDEETASAYIRNDLQHAVSDIDLHIVDLHEWLRYSSLTSRGVRTHYRNQELENIVTRASTNDRRVRDATRIFMKYTKKPRND